MGTGFHFLSAPVLTTMRISPSLTAPILLIALLGGCATSKVYDDPALEGTTIEQTSNPEGVVQQRARVFVDGVDRGITPKEIRIDRRFGTAEVLLRIGKERVRLFEVEQTHSSNASELINSFKLQSNGQYMTVNVEDLPKRNDAYVYIPFLDQPLLIEDNKYALTLLVQ
jgi:hypothetical protein